MTRFAALGRKITALWSITGFAAEDLNRYAEGFMAHEVRRGVMTLGISSLLLLAGAAFLYRSLGFSHMYVYTCGVLALLALHVTLSSRTVKQTQVMRGQTSQTLPNILISRQLMRYSALFISLDRTFQASFRASKRSVPPAGINSLLRVRS